MNNPNIPVCFFAYPSKPNSLSESIEIAIDEINSHGYVHALSWKDLRISGKVVISAICNEIRKTDLFICDLTYLNPNVLFELGFAIANNKRIWVMLNNSYQFAIEN